MIDDSYLNSNIYKLIYDKRRDLLRSAYPPLLIVFFFDALFVLFMSISNIDSLSELFSIQNLVFLIFFSILMFLIGWLELTRSTRFQLRVLKSSKINFHKVNELIRENKEFILYLYDFQSGQESIRIDVPPLSPRSPRAYYIKGNHRQHSVVDKLHKRISVVFFYNLNDNSEGHKGIAIPVADESWFGIYKTLCMRAKYVVLDYRLSFLESENVKRELEFIIGASNCRCLFLGTEKEYSKLAEEFPGIVNAIVGRFKMKERHTSIKKDAPVYYGVDNSDPLFKNILDLKDKAREQA